VSARRQKHVVLILAREFAANLATPTLIGDEEGRLIYYNEAAEELVGRRFAETGEVSLDEWTSSFSPRSPESGLLPAEERPARIALDQRRAAYQRYRATAGDGVERDIAVAAFPLFAQADRFVGVVVMFWPD
jgi:PAS domain-containing protein